MAIKTSELHCQTKGHTDIVDITGAVRGKLAESGLEEGVVVLFVVGSTAALTTCEFEPGLVRDLKVLFEKLIPEQGGYAHDATWGDANGFSHLRSSLLGPSLFIPFRKGALLLGTWQQIVLIDFDNRPRGRTVVVQLQGEGTS